MSDQSKDRLEGAMDKATGQGKSAFGDLTDNDQQRAEGDLDQTKGEAKEGMAGLKDKADEMVKKVTGS